MLQVLTERHQGKEVAEELIVNLLKMAVKGKLLYDERLITKRDMWLMVRIPPHASIQIHTHPHQCMHLFPCHSFSKSSNLVCIVQGDPLTSMSLRLYDSLKQKTPQDLARDLL